MATERQRAALKREDSRRWYRENRDDYNILRRKRYAANRDIRIKARNRAAINRIDSVAGIIPHKTTKREIEGRVVELLSTGYVAGILEVTPQTIRNWERFEYIPCSIFVDDHRWYTKKQVRLLVVLFNTVKKNGGRWGASSVLSRIDHTFNVW